MISELTVNIDLVKNTPDYKYISELPLLKDDGKIAFKEGLNVIFAPNGSGKTTILEMLAKATHSREWGYSRPTKKSMLDEKLLRKISKEEMDARDLSFYSLFAVEPFFEVKHDAQTVLFCDPKFIVGGFGADDTLNFGYEYMSAHKEEHINVKGSTGNKNKHRMSLVNDVLDGIKKVDSKIDDKYTSKMSLSSIDRFKAEKFNLDYLQPSIEKGQTTILIDEPETALDLREKIKWFKSLEEKVKKQNLQVILITHSELALTFKDANFITSDNAYIEEARNEFLSLINIV